MRTNILHKPVLLQEVLNLLEVKSKGRYIDATVGAGGHATEICKLGGEILALDQDPVSVQIAQENLEKTCPDRYRLVPVNFSKISSIASRHNWTQVDGILMDLGFASFQVDDPRRGLSFSKDGPLDMRLDPTLGVTAADLVNSLPAKELEHLFREYGEEPRARAIARAIVQARKVSPFETTSQLAKLVETLKRKTQNENRLPFAVSRIHSATRVFMALRIAVNSELENLKSALPQALDLLKGGGRLAIISFHSGEDRIVKTAFKGWEKEKVGKVLTKKPVVPTYEEIQNNPRARSAKLRVLEKS